MVPAAVDTPITRHIDPELSLVTSLVARQRNYLITHAIRTRLANRRLVAIQSIQPELAISSTQPGLAGPVALDNPIARHHCDPEPSLATIPAAISSIHVGLAIPIRARLGSRHVVTTAN